MYELGRVQRDDAKGSIQRKSNLSLASCLLAVEAAMVPCGVIYTQPLRCEISLPP